MLIISGLVVRVPKFTFIICDRSLNTKVIILQRNKFKLYIWRHPIYDIQLPERLKHICLLCIFAVIPLFFFNQ